MKENRLFFLFIQEQRVCVRVRKENWSKEKCQFISLFQWTMKRTRNRAKEAKMIIDACPSFGEPLHKSPLQQQTVPEVSPVDPSAQPLLSAGQTADVKEPPRVMTVRSPRLALIFWWEKAFSSITF